MSDFRTSKHFTALLAAIDAHLAGRLKEKGTTGKSSEALRFETAALQKILQQLRGASTDEQLVKAYDDAKALRFPVQEEPQTIGENDAGEWLVPRIRDALEDLDIEYGPRPAPGTKSAPKRQ